MEMLSQGREGTGSGVYKPNLLLLGLLVAHKEHPLTYLETLSFILDQYQYLCKLVTALPTPKWPTIREE
jgi:hypothetical protein